MKFFTSLDVTFKNNNIVRNSGAPIVPDEKSGAEVDSGSRIDAQVSVAQLLVAFLTREAKLRISCAILTCN